MLTMPRGAVREYLIAFGVAAIYLAVMPGGTPCIVGVTRDIERTRRSIRRKLPKFLISAVWWVRNRDAAHLISAEVNARLPHQHVLGSRIVLSVDSSAAQSVIERVASDYKAKLTRHSAALARVNAAVIRVQGVIDTANRQGDLRWFNQAFRVWRLNAEQEGGRVMSYSEALARLRRSVTKRLITDDKIELSTTLAAEVLKRGQN